MSHSTSGISHVLKAIGLSDEKASNSIRVSISRFTTEEEIDYFIEKMEKNFWENSRSYRTIN